MKKAIKIPLIILSVLLSLVLLFVIGYGIFYMQVDAIRFDYTNTMMGGDGTGNQTVVTPFFGNSLMLNEGGFYKVYRLEPGIKNLPIYDAINGYMSNWSLYITTKYQKVDIDYTVDRDGDIITINLNGSGSNDGEQAATIEEKFVFDVSDASPENLPKLTNEDEINKEFVELDAYFRNPREVPRPEGLSDINAA